MIPDRPHFRPKRATMIPAKTGIFPFVERKGVRGMLTHYPLWMGVPPAEAPTFVGMT